MNSNSLQDALNPQATSNQGLQRLAYRHYFSFTLHSPLVRLSLNKANKLYTNKTVVEVIKHTLSLYELHKNLDFKDIQGVYQRLELITQYEESDLAFITRLAHNNGIYFYEDENSIYFKDSFINENLRHINFNANQANNALNSPCIFSLSKEESLRALSFTHTAANVL
ncbi:hypothetical protein DMC01_13485, partial [Campylobacter troglodytis]